MNKESFSVVALHVGKNIGIKEARNLFNYQLIKREASFLLYEASDNAYVYIKDYGSIVFYNCKNDIINQFLKKISENENYGMKYYNKEEYQVYKSENLEVDFNAVYLNNFDIDFLHIIMLNLAQSVALGAYVKKTSSLYESTLVYTKQLEFKGRINLSKIKMRKFIGKTLNIKNTITEELFVFDTSNLAWSNESLSLLDTKLKEELDIEKRFKGLHLSLDTIKENLGLFNELSQHKYSSMLEWIIIILILFEVVQIFV